MIDLSREAIEDMAQGIADNLGGIVHDGRDVSDTLRAQAARIAALEAQLAEAVEALEGLIPVLEAIMKEEGRGIEWGEEDPFRMGEWFEDEDRHQMARARAFLIAAHLQRREA